MTLREKLDKAIKIYSGKIEAERYAMAGEDYSNVDNKADWAKVPNVNDAMLAALKEIGINNKDDLASEMLLDGVMALPLSKVQIPYFEKKAETEEEIKGRGKGKYYQIDNPFYNKPYKGFSFDDVYAVRAMFDILPENKYIYATNYHTYEYWLEPVTERNKAIETMEEAERGFDKIIKDYFDPNGSRYFILGWKPYKSSICCGSVQQRYELKKSLVEYIASFSNNGQFDDNRKTTLLAQWYVDNADANSDVNIWYDEAHDWLKKVEAVA